MKDKSYVEILRDFEGDSDKGLLIDKEYFVYSPGKTGTVTIYESIYNYLKLHVNRSVTYSSLLHNHSNAALVSVLEYPKAVNKSELLKRPIIRDVVELRAKRNQKSRVVSCYREPIARAISGTFQQVDRLLRTGSVERAPEFEAIKKRFLDNMEHSKRSIHSLEEINPDFFKEHVFNHDRKCCHVNDGMIEVLVLRLEDATQWQKLISDNFDMPGLELITSNRAEEKSISQLYKNFKNTLRLDEEYVKNVYYGTHQQARQLSWFYTELEIEGMYENAIERYCV